MNIIKAGKYLGESFIYLKNGVGLAQSFEYGVQGIAESFGMSAAAAETFAAALGPILIALLAIGATIWVVDQLTESFQEATEKAAQSKQAYETTKSEIQSLNSELETTQTRIAELKAQGSLTLVEKEELSRLERQNELLETQIGLKQRTAELQNQQAITDAKNVLSKQISVDTGQVEWHGNNAVTVYEKMGIIDKIKYEQDKLNAAQAEYDELLLEQSRLESKNLENSNEYAANSRRLRQLTGDIDQYTQDLAADLSIVNDQYDTLVSGGLTKDDSAVAEILDLYEYIKTDAQRAAEVDQAIRNYINSQKSTTVDSLLQQAKDNNGITADDIIAQFTGIEKAAEEAGLTVDDFAQSVADSITPKSSELIMKLISFSTRRRRKHLMRSA